VFVQSLAGGIAYAVSTLLTLVLSLVVLAAGPKRRINRGLSALLGAQTVMSAFLTVDLLFVPNRWSLWIFVARIAAITGVGVGSLAFLSVLQTPATRWLRNPWVSLVLGGVIFVVGWLLLERAVGARGFIAEGDDIVVWFALGAASIFGLVASVDALRRTTPGTIAHRHSSAFLAAFGTRDVAYAVSVVFWAWGFYFGRGPLRVYANFAIGLAAVAFATLLSYGILRTQLFDIDLKIKVGIRRSTVVTIMIVVALAVAKTAEFYLDRTFGWVAGAVAAGAMLVLAPRLNKMGEMVANVAMPQVQPTPGYVAFKKLEVYRAAVETAQETGGIDNRQRLLLDKLRAKLALPPADCAAVEADLGVVP